MTTGSIQADFLKRVLDAGGAIAAQFSLQRSLLKFAEPVFFIELKQGDVLALYEWPWSDELEHCLLLERPTRMSTEEGEAERFAALLLNNLKSAETDHGADYAQSVFVELLGERAEGIADLLPRAPVYKPSRDGQGYQPCRKLLTESLEGVTWSAVERLRYAPAEASALVIAALRIVLDETFHISAREQMFPPDSAS